MTNVTTLATKKAPTPARVLTDAHLQAVVEVGLGVCPRAFDWLRCQNATPHDVESFWRFCLPTLLGWTVREARDFLREQKAPGVVHALFERRHKESLAAERLAASADDLLDDEPEEVRRAA